MKKLIAMLLAAASVMLGQGCGGDGQVIPVHVSRTAAMYERLRKGEWTIEDAKAFLLTAKASCYVESFLSRPDGTLPVWTEDRFLVLWAVKAGGKMDVYVMWVDTLKCRRVIGHFTDREGPVDTPETDAMKDWLEPEWAPQDGIVTLWAYDKRYCKEKRGEIDWPTETVEEEERHLAALNSCVIRGLDGKILRDENCQWVNAGSSSGPGEQSPRDSQKPTKKQRVWGEVLRQVPRIPRF